MTEKKLEIEKITKSSPKGGLDMLEVSYLDLKCQPEKFFVDTYIERALAEAYLYGEEEKLIKLSDAGFTELFDEDFKDLYLGFTRGEHKCKHVSPKKNKYKKDDIIYIWKKAHYYKGRGYPMTSRIDPDTCAIGIAGREVGLKYRQSQKLFRIAKDASKKQNGLFFRFHKNIQLKKGEKDKASQ